MKPGDKVICVDDTDYTQPDAYSEVPVKGRVYVIRQVRLAYRNQGLSLLLIGITGSFYTVSGTEAGFLARRFRLLDELRAESRQRQQQEEKA